MALIDHEVLVDFDLMVLYILYPYMLQIMCVYKHMHGFFTDTLYKEYIMNMPYIFFSIMHVTHIAQVEQFVHEM